MSQTNGTPHNNGHAADEAIDALFAYWPGATPAPAPCPEAIYSCTLRGTIGGVDSLLTVRGMSSEEFTRNLQAVKGLLDAKPQPTPQAPVQGEGWCSIHNTALQVQHGKDGRTWLSHRTADGQWCKGR